MKIMGVPLAWAVVGLVELVLLMSLVGYLVMRNKRDANGLSTDDTWERDQDRRRRKELWYGVASYTLLFCCAAVAAALSFRGLMGFGRENLGLTDGWEYLVPLGLDGAAMFCSVLAVREASHGDAALGSRILVWTFAGASAWFNWVHAPRGMGHAGAPQFFAGMSLSAAVLFDRALKQTRRAALREQGLVPRPLPQIRIVRWLRAPRETYAAWSLMLLENVRTLDEAVEEVREDRRAKLDNRERRRLQSRRERAQLKAISRGDGRHWGRGPRQEIAALPGGGGSEAVSEPAIAENATSGPGTHSTSRPALPAASEGTIDLTAEDDTMTLPRLDSLERKLKDLERQFG
ncbi:DUF2637 domain-containing protein [Yinghuangia seranimata]|uniref:DUF2637 domain-containing protein n=1 Tax=Yinghuangia seranimata TaxID=408067 RepID=UPI00248C1771|nr:DUF2637 domain-containing protein [Yinghuangia seranimata]MDI2126713.1 DUF2637 domain-containing protein [Yinghuangia seranimata]